MKRQSIFFGIAKVVAISFVVILVLIFTEPHSAPASIIGIDAIHGTHPNSSGHRLFDGSMYDTLRTTITDLGHTIVPLYSFEADDFASVDAVILMISYINIDQSPYSESEIAAIHAFADERAVFLSDSSMFIDGYPSQRSINFGDNKLLLENIINFLENGGALFIGDDGTDLFAFDIANWNTLVGPYGVLYADVGTEENGHTITGFVDHPITAGLNEIGVDFQIRITANAPSIDLTINSDADDALAVFESYENTPPVADPNGPYLCAAGVQCQFDGSGSGDPDGDPLSYEWQFGDGSIPSTAESPSHIYTDAFIYDVCLTVDDGCEIDTACTIAVVYDPDAGFVTGGGWIWSETGWCQLDDVCASAEGKANFGFVSKYKKSATEPSGNTEFNFNSGGLNFHSSSYQWMVVTGNDYAKFKGSGTINGEGDYKFMLWASDDDPDTFRIRIWEEDELGNETDIYDNGFNQEIGGGSIVIHTK